MNVKAKILSHLLNSIFEQTHDLWWAGVGMTEVPLLDSQGDQQACKDFQNE